MKTHTKKLIISLSSIVLLVAVIVSVSMFGANAEDESEYRSNIGKLAEFNYEVCINAQIFIDAKAYLTEYGDPLYYEGEDATYIEFEDLTEDVKFVIKDYHHDAELAVLWYKVDAAPGYELPEIMKTYPWVYYDYTDYEDGFEGYPTLIIHDCGVNTVKDEKGNPIESLSIREYEKKKISAETSLQGTSEFSWQVWSPKLQNWVNVYDADTSELSVSAALLNSCFENGTAKVRSVAWNGENFGYSEALPVTFFRNAGGNNLQGFGTGIKTDSIKQNLAGVSPLADDTYTITVHFVDEDGTKVFDDHVEAWPLNTPVSHGITIRYSPGYDSYYSEDPNKTPITVFSLADKGIDGTKNMEFTIVYTPSTVKFTVHYLFQHITDDNYERDDNYPSQVFYGKTGDHVGDIINGVSNFVPIEVDGFYVIYYDKVEIAADGSTEVEVYYDRQYYLIDFELSSGGYGTEPVYARFGTNIVPNVPTRHGYIFQGWSPNIEKINGAYQTKVVDNATYTALWGQGPTTYTVVFWRENANPDTTVDEDGKTVVKVDADGKYPVYSYSYWAQLKNIPATTGDVIDGNIHKDDINALVEDETYFTYNIGKTDREVLIEGDGSSVVNVYYTRNEYVIYFHHGSNCNIPLHGHNEDCEQNICEKEEHEHTDCNLICGIPEHIHTDDACKDKCTLTEHTHNSTVGECCGITPHTHDGDSCTVQFNCKHSHTIACYGNPSRVNYTYGSGAIGNISGHPKSGCVYYVSTNRNTYYYLYLGGSYYSLNQSQFNAIKSGEAIGEGSSNSYGTTYTATAYNTNVDSTCTHKSHDSSCYSCILTEHIHGTGCNADACTHAYEHTHGDGNCQCTLDNHTHTTECYLCKTDEHLHSDDCVRYACGLIEHPTHTNCPATNNKKVVAVIKAKYEANIAKLWPTTSTVSQLRYWSYNGMMQSSRVVTMTADWCNSDGAHATSSTGSGSNYTLNYWFEDYDQNNETASDERKEVDGVWYVLNKDYTQTDAYYTSGQGSWSYKAITGMIGVSTSATVQNNTANLYYTRVRSTLTFVNSDSTTVLEFTGDNEVMFEQPIGLLTFTDEDGNTKFVSELKPKFPTGKEPNSLVFEGWYTTPECFEGTSVEDIGWNKLLMPHTDYKLFAKWVPSTHEVNVYLDSTLTTQIGETQAIKHNDSANRPDSNFDKGKYEGYVHAGWFYIDEKGVERAFSFNNMPVKRDINIYAKWFSTVPVHYQVGYYLGEQQKDANGNLVFDSEGHPVYVPVLDTSGNKIPVAEISEGTKLVGRSLTFLAKAGTQLYEQYRGGGGKFYFPHVNSHTLHMEENEGINTFDFLYIEMEVKGYTVKYLDEATGESIIRPDGTPLPDKVIPADENDYSVVTETFVAVTGYVSDAYQKTLVISANEDENVIIFWYTADAVNTVYRVNYYIEIVDSNGNHKGYEWDDFYESEGKIGEVPNIVKANILGYTYYGYSVEDGPIIAGEPVLSPLESSGALINLYYNINKYSYKVEYVENGTGTVLADPLLFTKDEDLKIYGTTVSATAIDIPGYELISDKKKNWKIDVEADNSDPQRNVITFVYVEKQAHFEYVIVPSADAGELSIYSESVLAKSGTARGSTAYQFAKYEFLGWYTDEACTVPVDPSWVDGENHLDPQRNSDGLYEDATYYAKFKLKIAPLTIAVDARAEEGRSFIYRIQGNGVDLFVTVTSGENPKNVDGNSYVTVEGLYIGQKYKVTQMTEWSWTHGLMGSRFEAGGVLKDEFTDNNAEITLGESGNVITFANIDEYAVSPNGTPAELPNWVNSEAKGSNK